MYPVEAVFDMQLACEAHNMPLPERTIQIKVQFSAAFVPTDQLGQVVVDKANQLVRQATSLCLDGGAMLEPCQNHDVVSEFREMQRPLPPDLWF
jgi:hypothetical protein